MSFKNTWMHRRYCGTNQMKREFDMEWQDAEPGGLIFDSEKDKMVRIIGWDLQDPFIVSVRPEGNYANS
jgi:hypothetical protein